MAVRKDISLIIPFLNEKDNLHFLIPELNLFFSTLPDVHAEVIFVDDGSSDDSINIIHSNRHENYQAKIIKLAKNSGSHAAVRAGIFYSEGNYIVTMAADLQDPLSLVLDMYRKCLNGFDVVVAQRKTINSKSIPLLFSRIYASLMRKYAIVDFPERGADVIMFNDKIKEVINQNIEANSNYVLQILSLGFKKAFIEYDKGERKYGVTKWTLSKKIKLFIDSFVAFSYAPVRFVTMMGTLFSIIGFAWTIYIIARTLFVGDLSPGWPALISVLLIGFGITNISLGIIAEYLWRTLDASRKRPVFIIDEIIELNSR